MFLKMTVAASSSVVVCKRSSIKGLLNSNLNLMLVEQLSSAIANNVNTNVSVRYKKSNYRVSSYKA